MGDTLRPYMLVVLPNSPIPSPPPPTKSNTMPMLYYGLVVVGTAAIILAIYNILFIRCCADNSGRGRNSTPRVQNGSGNLDKINLISSTFKYMKEGGDQASDYECAVCLSVLEEGEELRQLPTCKHSFHAPCIDMWLHSHLDCPLCRSLVEPPVFCLSPPAEAPVVNLAVTTRQQRAYREAFLNTMLEEMKGVRRMAPFARRSKNLFLFGDTQVDFLPH